MEEEKSTLKRTFSDVEVITDEVIKTKRIRGPQLAMSQGTSVPILPNKGKTSSIKPENMRTNGTSLSKIGDISTNAVNGTDNGLDDNERLLRPRKVRRTCIDTNPVELKDLINREYSVRMERCQVPAKYLIPAEERRDNVPPSDQDMINRQYLVNIEEIELSVPNQQAAQSIQSYSQITNNENVEIVSWPTVVIMTEAEVSQLVDGIGMEIELASPIFEEKGQNEEENMGPAAVSCPSSLPSPSSVNNQTDQDNVFPCKEEGCIEVYESMRELLNHIKWHQTKNRFNCDCGKTFVSRAHLIVHKRQKHKEAMFCCTFENCDKDFLTEDEMKSHVSIHAHKTYHCDFCKNSYITKTHLKRHMESHHTPVKKIFECIFPGCNSKYSHKESLAAHMLKHGPISYRCDICEKQFTRPCDLRAHVKTHTFTNCPEPGCGYTSNLVTEFKKHVRIHGLVAK